MDETNAETACMDYVAARYEARDAARMAELEAWLSREPKPGELCRRGHNEWRRIPGRSGRRCMACHRERMAEARARKGKV